MPPGLACAVEEIGDPAARLLPLEAKAVACAVPKRQAEFAAGRLAIRRACARAGMALPALQPIGILPDRRPDLPPGLAVSLSHSARFCVALATRDTRLMPGVDLEPMAARLPEGMAEIIAPFRISAEGVPDELLCFCAKEAVYKSQFPQSLQMLDFSDLALVVRGRRFRAQLGCGAVISGRWEIAEGHLLAISWRSR
ncbi:4'-phosphopantetheinyl transferase [Paracoccus aminophilus JCM 7686]|uniref:4'-phosphopantetheinyl transferase n=2 Tax=Paracoccus aminophilus TaxID=34003 RepID=S5YYA9_PARAH|nr:4'-phosphopantetheinyl transferase [Paracoccus aminophilus JCM 7686]